MHKLSDYLAANHLTHEAMAARLGVSRAHFTKLTNGAAFPSRDLMVRIERETGGAVPILSWFPQEAAE